MPRAERDLPLLASDYGRRDTAGSRWRLMPLAQHRRETSPWSQAARLMRLDRSRRQCECALMQIVVITHMRMLAGELRPHVTPDPPTRCRGLRMPGRCRDRTRLPERVPPKMSDLLRYAGRKFICGLTCRRLNARSRGLSMSQVTGRSEFTLVTSLPINQVVRIAQSVLDSYEQLPSLLKARAVELGDREFSIELSFSSDSFAEAEELMDEMTESIASALRGTEAALEQGITELVSA